MLSCPLMFTIENGIGTFLALTDGAVTKLRSITVVRRTVVAANALSVSSPVSGGTGNQYLCTGWTGSGSAPSSGSTSSVSFTINATSSITRNIRFNDLLMD